MKTCIKCNKTADEIYFKSYKNKKGEIRYNNICKDCIAKYRKEHYQNNKEKYLQKCKEYVNNNKEQTTLNKHKHYISNKEKYLKRSRKQRLNNPEAYKEYMKAYYKANIETIKLKRKEYASRLEIKNKINAYNRIRWHKPENNIKNKARTKVNTALKSGVLIRPEYCSCCGAKTFVEAHHKDYNKPLEITWLCKKCHENTHHLNEGQTS